MSAAEVGQRIKLLGMPNDPSPIEAGATGTIKRVLNAGTELEQVDVEWDNGRTLMLIPGVDSWEVLDERPQRLEFTIAVCVPFAWDADGGRYVLVESDVELTNGGLFYDAESGPWDPERGEWIGADSPEAQAASQRAHSLVDDALRVHLDVVGGGDEA